MANLAIYNFSIIQGDTFQFTAYITDPNDVPIDITGWTVRMQVRNNDDCGGDLIVEMSTLNGAIVLTGPTGQFDITLLAGITAQIPPDIYQYDFETTDLLGIVKTRFGGTFTINAQVTQ